MGARCWFAKPCLRVALLVSPGMSGSFPTLGREGSGRSANGLLFRLMLVGPEIWVTGEKGLPIERGSCRIRPNRFLIRAPMVAGGALAERERCEERVDGLE